MHGQWIGTYQSEGATGEITVEIDESNDRHYVSALLYRSSTGIPINGLAQFEIEGTATNGYVITDLTNVDLYGNTISIDQLKDLFPQTVFPTAAQVRIKWSSRSMQLSWVTNTNRKGKGRLSRSDPNKKSDYPLNIVTWEKFKEHISSLAHRQHVFRGQSSAWRLRTHFHRSGRSNLLRYLNGDMVVLHRHLSAHTTHVFNRMIPDENGAFFNLAQHHGYPTPLLDWSYSPFVAAFFAFRTAKQITQRSASSGFIRLFQLNKIEWDSLGIISQVAPAIPHFSLLEFIAVENKRLIPQQSISGLTNIDDVESYIRKLESLNAQTYLEVFDIPVSERQLVMQDLSTMGITAGSLFPGLDGACEELRERFFAT